jgi:peptidoglycan/LPS O-acetylase OafA/YrhL
VRPTAAPAGYFPADFELGHRPALDGLRGIAVLIVLVGHGPIPFLGGGPGVTMFFTLSGFLITALLLQERRGTGRVDLGRFYARRALRLLPALAVCLVVVAIALTMLDTELTGVWYAALYVANLAPALGAKLPYLSHTWSLSLEEQFYVVWPLTLLLLASTRRRWAVVAAVTAGIVGCALLRVLVDPDALVTQRQAVHVGFYALWRADALLVGCLLALLLRPALQLSRSLVGWAGALGMVTVLVASVQARSDLYYSLWITVVPLATAAILLWVLPGDTAVARAMSWRPLRYTGRISYGLYLWHFPIFVLLRPHLEHLPGVVEIALATAVSFVVASLSFLVVERPFLRLKRRFEPRRPDPVAVTGGRRLAGPVLVDETPARPRV